MGKPHFWMNISESIKEGLFLTERKLYKIEFEDRRAD